MAGTSVCIRDFREADLPALFEIQRDFDSRWMAAFGSRDLDDQDAYLRHMSKIAGDENVIFKVVELENQVVGIVGKWVHDQVPELMYMTDQRFRGKGITSAAVKEFLTIFTERPLFAHTAGDNLASQAILEKLGFSKYEEVMSFSEIRNMKILEVGFLLNQ